MVTENIDETRTFNVKIYNAPNQDNFGVYDGSNWRWLDHFEYFKVKKKQNQVSEFEIKFYDIKVEESSDSPSQRRTDLAMILDHGDKLFGTHPELLPLIFLDLTDLHDKEKYISMIQQADSNAAQQATSEMEQKKQQTIVPAQIKAQVEMAKLKDKQGGESK